MSYLKSGLLLQRKTFSASFSGCIPSTSNAKRRMDGNIVFQKNDLSLIKGNSNSALSIGILIVDATQYFG